MVFFFDVMNKFSIRRWIWAKSLIFFAMAARKIQSIFQNTAFLSVEIQILIESYGLTWWTSLDRKWAASKKKYKDVNFFAHVRTAKLQA